MNRAGKWVQNLSGDSAYKSFSPNPLPPKLEIDTRMANLLANASRNLKQLDVSAKLIPNAELFVLMYVRKEAIISSQIEGTQCTLVDLLDPELNTNVNLDAAEVVNYINAVQFALERMKELPLCNRLLREIHEKLMEGVRGEDKNPGEFRRSQNWIGPKGCSLKEARYIPPNVEDMLESMSDLEKYINYSEDYDPLIQAGLVHYQFESIHPFLDGNGRIGRLLILLYLMKAELLAKPVIYVSYFMKKNQLEYYDRIGEVRRTGNFEQWICFFLEAVSAAAEDAVQTIERLIMLHDSNLAKLPQTKRKPDNLRVVFDYVEQYPIIDIKHTAEALRLSYNTVSNAVRKLVELNILIEPTNASRNRVYFYEEYLNILRKDTE